MNPFTIVVDSSCDLPAEYIKEHDIEVLPMPFDLDDRAYNSGYWQEISAKEYYDALRKGSVAKTSQINPITYSTSFMQYAKQGKEALFIILSSGLSSTYQNAKLAYQEVKEAYPNCGIFPIDSINATSGHGLLAMQAVNKRAQGLSASETAAWLEEQKHSYLGIFTVDDLMYLHRGGRLSKFSAIAGSALKIKPILNIAADGSLCLREKVRGRKAALELIVSHVKRSIGPHTALETVTISHTDCQEYAESLAEMLKAAVSVQNIVLTQMGPLIGAHLGPGAVTLVFKADMTRTEYENKFYS